AGPGTASLSSAMRSSQDANRRARSDCSRTPPTSPPPGPCRVTATRGDSRNRVTRSEAPAASGMNNESTWWSGTTFDMTSPGWRPARFSPMPRCITAALLMSREISSTGQAEDALCDDVRLHLGGAAGDRADARPQERLLPASAVASGGELRFRPEQLERELVQALRQVRPEELHQGRLRTGLL